MLKVRCQAQATLDDKGRVALPSALRRAMDVAGVRGLVLTLSGDGEAVWGFEPQTFEDTVERRLADADPYNPDVLDWIYARLAHNHDAEVDAQGRVRIPPVLRQQAGLEREVVVNSYLDRVEIWDRARWEKRLERARTSPSAARGMPRSTP